MDVALKEFNQISGKINAIYHKAALKLGLSDSEMNILYTLCNKGSGCRQSALYKETGMTRSTVNSAIRKMEKAGILYLKTGEGRNTCVVLTEKGEQYLAQTAGRLIEAENKLFARWTQEEREMFLCLNRKMEEELRRAVEEL